MKRRLYQLRAGALSNLQLAESELPAPGAREVTVAVQAVGLNFADIFAIWGLYGATPEGLFTPGLEYSGTVIRTGSEVSSFREGDRVMGVTRFGAYTSHLNIDQRYLLPLPAGWSFREGAAYLVQLLTAYYGLVNLGNLQARQNVLIHSAAGGVGIHAGRIARKMGAYTIGTVGSDAKLDFLRREGYHHGIRRNPATFRQDLRTALGDRPLHLIMDSIGGKFFKTGFEQLAPMGRHIVYGAARYTNVGNRPNYARMLWLWLTRPKIDPQKLPEMNKSVMGFNLIWIYDRAELMHQILREAEALDLPKPHVGHTFPFTSLKEALRLFQTGMTSGKVVLDLD